MTDDRADPNDPTLILATDLLRDGLLWLKHVHQFQPEELARITTASLDDGRLRVLLVPGPAPTISIYCESSDPSQPPLEISRLLMQPPEDAELSDGH